MDLLTLANFTDPPTQRGNSILRLGRSHAGDTATPTGAQQSPESSTDSRLVFPCTIHHNGRLGGLYTVFAVSQQARNEWKQKLEEAIGLRKVVQDSNKVFEIETLSADTFLVPAMGPSSGSTSWNHENAFTGKVTCSVPFSEYSPHRQHARRVDIISSYRRWSWTRRDRLRRGCMDRVPSRFEVYVPSAAGCPWLHSDAVVQHYVACYI